ncbi:stage III sporulation protein SpoIIIAB [Virgibacillus soli]|uniref:stage III sporulation protein SpoIIIAB n=1 Tax=Paracerasibacillus soli TaxID=480284 RepID=UPI0035E5BD98
MKWIGALLFISTTTWAGFEWSKRLVNRPKHIRQLKNALQILEAEILYSQAPLIDAFELISKQIPKPTKYFFQMLTSDLNKNKTDFLEIWEKGVATYMKQSSLGPNETEILYQFGRTLGQHDFTQQQKQIVLTLNHLDRELQEAKASEARYAKMAKSLGFLCGLFIVLLLM